MGCDYVIDTFIEIEMIVEDNNYNTIFIEHDKGYFGDNYDSDNLTQRQYEREVLDKHYESKVIYENGVWTIKNIDKYLNYLKEDGYDISKIKTITKIREASYRN